MEVTEHKITNEELITLIKCNSQGNNKWYYELLYQNNYSLFYKLAWKYSHISWCYDIEDLLQEAYISLTIAVKYYNKELNKPFFNFLFLVANQTLYRKVNGTSNKDLAAKKKEAYVSLYQTLYESKDGDTQELIETIASEEAQRQIDSVPEQLFLLDLQKAEIQAIDTLLSPREREIIKLYYGFDSIPYSTNEIAEMLSITRSRVNEALRDSCRKLKRDKNLRYFYNTEYAWR